MSLKLIQLTGIVLCAAFSTIAFAGEGGGGCSKNKAHQELSADALKNLDENHFWSKFFDHHPSDKSVSGHGNKMIEKTDKKSTSGLIES